MRAYDLIRKKRDGEAHTRAEIEFLIREFTQGRVETYQMTAWMMAVFLRGMNDDETGWLTEAMVESGDKVDLSSIPGVKVDKHSTGGVGDTTTLILAPLAAAAGAKVAKMSGRGLGHTGGTLDKMESVPGLRVDLSPEKFLAQVREIGVAVISQTGTLVPADGKMYALRDVTATVDSIPLIASSIMSKKLACGADAILLDVKFGHGAFMKNLDDARKLAHSMVAIGQRLGRKVRAALSDMEQPLGTHIGNALEFREAIEILRGERPGSALAHVASELAAHLLDMAGLSGSLEEARREAQRLVDTGKAADKLRELIAAQGGDARVVDDPDLLPRAAIQEEFLAERDGFVASLEAETLGRAAMELGAGRVRKDDPIDHAVGVVLHKRLGDPVEKGEKLLTFHANEASKLEPARHLVRAALSVAAQAPAARPLIQEVVS